MVPLLLFINPFSCKSRAFFPQQQSISQLVRVQQAPVSALESEVGLQQIRIIVAIDVHLYRITSSKSVKEAIVICEKKPFVQYAEPNHQYKALNN